MTKQPASKRDAVARKQSIVDAAVRVIARDGISGLTHRAAAAEAGVPLGLTTYYFSDKNELARIALEQARASFIARDTLLIEGLIAEYGSVAGVARYVEQLTGVGREQLVLDYRVYVSVLYSPALRDAVTWPVDGRIFGADLPDDQADAFGVIVDGLLMRAVMQDVAVSAEEAEALLRRQVGVQ